MFIDNWNMVEQPLILLNDVEKQPLSMFLSSINAGEIGIEVQLQHKCGPMAAGAIVFSKEYGRLCQTAQAQALLEKIKEN